ncbi:hypothetical protein BLA24064_00302 [Burkholderia latens]|uniref:Uncharacterized protein n=1 Tax=Burkholderia latens TaxID=488446 RepID=A0A6P2H087_9BURK|nr:hypothetical protein BLA24064_00302 [Burkholderia latens]
MASQFLTFIDGKLQGKRQLFDLSLSSWPRLRWALSLPLPDPTGGVPVPPADIVVLESMAQVASELDLI